METVTDEGRHGTAAPPSSATSWRSPPSGQPGQDLRPEGPHQSGLKVVLCDKTVPCGAAAQKALEASGLKLTPVSQEQDVKGALTKVELKEADASVVYKTDVKAAGDKVDGVEFPESAKAVNDYPIAAARRRQRGGRHGVRRPDESAEGQKVLTAAGFQTP